VLASVYIKEQKIQILQKESMNMYLYFLELKNSKFKYEKDGYSYEMEVCSTVSNSLPQKIYGKYVKTYSDYYIIYMDASIVDDQYDEVVSRTLWIKLALLFVTLILSYLLATFSIRPLSQTISHLDRFLGDLIHDLNTPIASIRLNAQMLEKLVDYTAKTKLQRIQTSTKNITALYENLKINLDKTNLEKSRIHMKPLIDDMVANYKQLNPDIEFVVYLSDDLVKTNKVAIQRVVDNILSNSCKYKTQTKANITITFKNKTLTIQDNGKGIKYPKKVFERNYKENQSGYGIGLHIVYRICSNLGHNIEISSKQNTGTIVKITFF
jgi:two-component system OmpR family sensor kinase